MHVRCFCWLVVMMLYYSPIAAQIPVGSWREHLPYRNAIALAAGNGKIYCATPYALMTYDPIDNTVEELSKYSGLSEIGLSAISANVSGTRLAVAYKNSNIDLIEGNRIYNINEILLKNVIGDKSIQNITWNNNLIYLSTGLGIVVLDADKRQVKDTWIPGSNGNYLAVQATAFNESSVFAATNEGLKQAPLNGTNLADYRNWSLLSGKDNLPQGPTNSVVFSAGSVYTSVRDTVWMKSGNTSWKIFFAPGKQVGQLNVSTDKLFISARASNQNEIHVFNSDGTLERIITRGNGVIQPKTAMLYEGEYYIADSLAGLTRLNKGSYFPDGPGGFSNGQLVFRGNQLLVAAGGVNEKAEKLNKPAGIFSFDKEQWTQIDSSTLPSLAGSSDLWTLAAGATNIWAGSFGSGLVKITSNNSTQIFRENSFIRQSESRPGFYGIGGLSMDASENLWMTNYGALNTLVVYKSDGTTRSFQIPGASFDFAFTSIMVDDENQKWIIASNGNGLFCFNHGTSIDNRADDRWKRYQMGRGNGNLPANDVRCIAKDKSGFIWVGTSKGIGIIQCASRVFSNAGCDAVLPIVQQDNFAGYLFGNEEVQAIAIDAADRKWVGTKNGVWLINKYGDKTIQRFTAANSPLLDNDVRYIAIHPASGEVFFETAQGICSFRSDATEKSDSIKPGIVFPNPVPPTFTGTISITGLSPNVLVKITDLDGRLIYQTRANGTTASWNGLYKGKKVAAGVYLVLTREDDGKDRLNTKIVMVK